MLYNKCFLFISATFTMASTRNRNVGTEYSSVAEVLPLLEYSIQVLEQLVSKAWDGCSSITPSDTQRICELAQRCEALADQQPTPSQMRKFFLKKNHIYNILTMYFLFCFCYKSSQFVFVFFCYSTTSSKETTTSSKV